MNSSDPELLVLHAVRVRGFADTHAITDHVDMSLADTERILGELRDNGWIEYSGFFDLGGWALTEPGKVENERRLAEERGTADTDGVIEDVYREFLPLNARLLRAVTNWQTRPTEDDRYAVNDHRDEIWDGKILRELDDIGRSLGPLVHRLSSVLTRFNGYDSRFTGALRRAESGLPGWVDRTDLDSCHAVWFQLHEDLVATLGIDRMRES